MKTVKIKWRDSRRYVHQEEMQDFTVCEIETTGFLIQEDKTKLVLCQDLIDEDYRGVIVIPKENIISIMTK